ncbi:putative mSHA biogenesis protein MshQ BUT NOT, partial [Vibrio parahaemolyticus V-223/04]
TARVGRKIKLKANTLMAHSTAVQTARAVKLA